MCACAHTCTHTHTNRSAVVKFVDKQDDLNVLKVEGDSLSIYLEAGPNQQLEPKLTPVQKIGHTVTYKGNELIREGLEYYANAESHQAHYLALFKQEMGKAEREAVLLQLCHLCVATGTIMNKKIGHVVK